MRLLKPSPGEAADRQTILRKKCRFGKARRLDVRPFLVELRELDAYVRREWLGNSSRSIRSQYKQLFNALEEVNTELWKIEDEVRLLIKQRPLNRDRLVQIAIAVPLVNDQRSALVIEINKLFGNKEREKMYSSSPSI